MLRFLHEVLKCEVEGGILVAADADQLPCLEYFHSLGEPLTGKLAATAAKANALQCLRYLHDIGGVCDFSTLLSAATNGSLHCVKFLVENKCPGLASGFEKLLQEASNGGHLSVVQYLWDTCMDLRTATSEDRVCISAATYGHVHLLQFAHSRSFKCLASPPFSAAGIMAEAAYHKSIPSLEYLYSIGQEANMSVFSSAAPSGDIPTMQFLLNHNCPVNVGSHIAGYMLVGNWVSSFSAMKVLLDAGLPGDEVLISAVAERGDLADMEYLRARGCPWNEWTCGNAARGGQLHCLRYARENGCPWKDSIDSPHEHYRTITEWAALAPTLDCLKYAVEEGAPLNCETVLCALENGSLATLQYLLSVGCPLDARACEAAVEKRKTKNDDRLTFLRLLREHGCPWDERTCRAAAMRGALETLRFAHENGCPWDATVCAAAATGGSVECVLYVRANGCPWDERTCAGAARSKNYEILKYARDNGCPWDARTCAVVASTFNASKGVETVVSFLRFLHEQGCPWDEETCHEACHRDVYDYAVAHGCPGAELSRYSDPNYQDLISWEILRQLGF